MSHSRGEKAICAVPTAAAKFDSKVLNFAWDFDIAENGDAIDCIFIEALEEVPHDCCHHAMLFGIPLFLQAIDECLEWGIAFPVPSRTEYFALVDIVHQPPNTFWLQFECSLM